MLHYCHYHFILVEIFLLSFYIFMFGLQSLLDVLFQVVFNQVWFYSDYSHRKPFHPAYQSTPVDLKR